MDWLVVPFPLLVTLLFERAVQYVMLPTDRSAPTSQLQMTDSYQREHLLFSQLTTRSYNNVLRVFRIQRRTLLLLTFNPFATKPRYSRCC